MRKDKYNLVFSCTMVIIFTAFAVIGFIKHFDLTFSLGHASMAVGNTIWFVDEITNRGGRKTLSQALLYTVRFIFLIVGLVLMIIYAISKAAN